MLPCPNKDLILQTPMAALKRDNNGKTICRSTLDNNSTEKRQQIIMLEIVLRFVDERKKAKSGIKYVWME